MAGMEGMMKISESSRIGQQRTNFRISMAVAWLKENEPKVWQAICAEGFKRFPSILRYPKVRREVRSALASISKAKP
jgi:hypothetical protein